MSIPPHHNEVNTSYLLHRLVIKDKCGVKNDNVQTSVSTVPGTKEVLLVNIITAIIREKKGLKMIPN